MLRRPVFLILGCGKTRGPGGRRVFVLCFVCFWFVFCFSPFGAGGVVGEGDLRRLSITAEGSGRRSC